MDLKKEDRRRSQKERRVESPKERGVALSCELVGMRYGKISHAWRLELDVYEIDADKIKCLVDMIEKPVAVGIVEQE